MHTHSILTFLYMYMHTHSVLAHTTHTVVTHTHTHGILTNWDALPVVTEQF